MDDDNTIVSATYVSEWDNTITVYSDCKVNLTTKEVFDIRLVDIDGVDSLTREYIIIENDDNEHTVAEQSDYNPSNHEFWY